MAAARTAVRGLSSDDLTQIREHLSAGRRPKVLFTETAGQIAGQVGQVVELTDPAASEDWVVVRFGRDELPFSPADLVVAPRGAGRPAKRAEAPEPEAEPAGPELRLTEPPVPAPRTESTPSTPAPHSAAANGAEQARPAARKAAARPAKTKAPAGLTVTLAYADGEWTVAANQGSKVLAKPYVVRPVEAMKIVSLVDVPGVHEAVEQIVSVERAEAEQQAEKLRAELAEIEARLAELRDAS